MSILVVYCRMGRCFGLSVPIFHSLDRISSVVLVHCNLKVDLVDCSCNCLMSVCYTHILRGLKGGCTAKLPEWRIADSNRMIGTCWRGNNVIERVVAANKMCKVKGMVSECKMGVLHHTKISVCLRLVWRIEMMEPRLLLQLLLQLGSLLRVSRNCLRRCSWLRGYRWQAMDLDCYHILERGCK